MMKFLTDNYTLSVPDGYSIETPHYVRCMSFTRNLRKNTSIIIPFNEDLNKGVNEETIKNWVDIGNTLIFPAELSTGYFNSQTISPNTNAQYQIISKHIKDVVVKPKSIKPNNGKYFQSDASYIGTACLVNIDGSIDNYRGILLAITNKDGKSWTDNWTIDLRDFETIETGECLFELVTRLYDEHINDDTEKGYDPNKENAYVITIKYPEAVSGTHKLAMTMFYRYLYSDRYDGIVYHTLEAIKQGIDPWDALMLAHKFVMPKYDSYYGLLYSYPDSWYSMEEAKTRLRTCGYVNDALTKTREQTWPLLIDWNTTMPLDYNNLLKNEGKEVKRLTCVLPSKTLIKNKQYDVTISIGAMSGTVKCEDFVTRKINLKRFQN